MATHNSVQMYGFLKSNPVIIRDSEHSDIINQIIMPMTIVRRNNISYNGPIDSDVIILCDSPEQINEVKNYKQYDVITLKGVLAFAQQPMIFKCQSCNKDSYDVNNATSTAFIYPIWINKINSYEVEALGNDTREGDFNKPIEVLSKNYAEVSNQVYLMGTLVRDPEYIENGHSSYCKFPIGCNRKYFISTQNGIKADYPWVYIYGQDAEKVMSHLHFQSVVFIDGFIRDMRIEKDVCCNYCNFTQKKKVVRCDIIPYSIEFLSNYDKDEIEKKEESSLIDKLSDFIV